MMSEKERDGRERVVVVLDAVRAATDLGGVVPLSYALREVVQPDDEVLVLTILGSGVELTDASPLTSAGCCCRRDNGDLYTNGFHEEICKRKEAYAQIFRPYYEICNSSGVKFQVKIAATFQPQALVLEEANNVNATWIVMDRCFSLDQSFQLYGAQCNVALVNGDGEVVTQRNLPIAETRVQRELKPNVPETSIRGKGKTIADSSYVHHPQFETKHVRFLPPLASTSKELGETSSNKNNKKPRKNVEFNCAGFSTVNLVARMPLQLSWEMVEEITCGFTRMTCMDENKSFKSYCGYLTDHHSQVWVKKFTGEFDEILEAEKKAALFMYHKNILGLIGYHKSEYGTVLVYPVPRRGTLDKFLPGSKRKQAKLTFRQKIKIAIGIGQGLRYMHEECPRGPIVHGDLRPYNIFMKVELEPLITGFGKAKWLQQKQALPMSSNSFRHKNPSDMEALALVKSDIFDFGVLLLRLFCRRFAPLDDKIFVKWARPLLKQMAYHELLEEDIEYLDTYGVMRVMCAAARCIAPKPVSRPSISEVISLLKGETSCAVQLSPSSEGSPNVDPTVVAPNVSLSLFQLLAYVK